MTKKLQAMNRNATLQHGERENNCNNLDFSKEVR